MSDDEVLDRVVRTRYMIRGVDLGGGARVAPEISYALAASLVSSLLDGERADRFPQILYRIGLAPRTDISTSGETRLLETASGATRHELAGRWRHHWEGAMKQATTARRSAYFELQLLLRAELEAERAAKTEK